MPPTAAKTPITPDVQLACVRFSPCGTVLAAAALDGTVRRWDVTAAPAELPKLPGHNGWVSGIAFHPDKKRLYSVDSWGRLICWDFTAREPKKLWDVPAAHDGWARKVAVQPDGKHVATCGRDGAARLWDAGTGSRRAEFAAGDDLLALAFDPTGTLLLTGDLHGRVKHWNIAGGAVARTFAVKELYLLHRIQDVGGVRCLGFDAAGRTLFVGGAGPRTGGFVQAVPLLLALDAQSGKRLSQWKGASDAEGFVHDLRVHPAGHVVAVTSGQPGRGGVFFWTPGAAKPSFTAAKPNCHSLDLSPDGARLAVSATNANSSGNGRVKGKRGEYPGNHSPIYLWSLPATG